MFHVPCSMFHVPCSWFYRRPDVLPKILGNFRPRARAFDSARELPNFSQGISAKQKWSTVLKTKIVTAYRARMKLYHETRENGLYAAIWQSISGRMEKPESGVRNRNLNWETLKPVPYTRVGIRWRPLLSLL